MNVESQALALRRNARASVSRMLRCASRRAGEGSSGSRGAGEWQGSPPVAVVVTGRGRSAGGRAERG